MADSLSKPHAEPYSEPSTAAPGGSGAGPWQDVTRRGGHAGLSIPIPSWYKEPVIVLGIDPGTRCLGWGVVSREANRLTHVAHGVIRLDAEAPLAERLSQLDGALGEVIEQHRPDVGSVETLFFNKDAQAAAKLGHARGVVLLNFARRGIEVAEYQPAKVKRTIAGRGQADKRQVALMIRALLTLKEVPASDAADALALAVTHLRLGPLALQLTRRPRAPRRGTRGIPPALARLLAGARRLGA